MAFDAYRHMTGQGHCPSAAAFRALLDAQLARGGWEEADSLLATMVEQQSEGLTEEVRGSGQMWRASSCAM